MSAELRVVEQKELGAHIPAAERDARSVRLHGFTHFTKHLRVCWATLNEAERHQAVALREKDKEKRVVEDFDQRQAAFEKRIDLLDQRIERLATPKSGNASAGDQTQRIRSSGT